MKEFVDKLLERLEECTIQHKEVVRVLNESGIKFVSADKVEEIVNQLAEEYKHCALCYLGSPCEYQNAEADCEKCKSYDNEKHYCPKFCYVIENTVRELAENSSNDFCEWQEKSAGGIKLVREPHRMKLFHIEKERKFCPYCSKKIKVVE